MDRNGLRANQPIGFNWNRNWNGMSTASNATFPQIFPQAARTLLLLTVAAVALAGCSKLGIGKDDSAPTGQVVARLDGQEITTLEVNAELAGTSIPPTMARHDAEKLALGNILTRRMLAREAEQRALDKQPDFQLQQRRAEEQLRVQALARDIASKVATPTRDEAEKFIRENPNLFAERKFYILDQIQFPRPDNVADLGFEATKTLPQVEAILKANNIPYRRQPASLDTLTANPTFVREVTKVLEKDPNELFMFASHPQGAPTPVIMVNQVKESQLQPFTGDKAREFAVNHLRNERVQNALKAQVDQLQKTRDERVVFQEGWEVDPTQQPGAADTAADGTAGAVVPDANATGPVLPGGAEDLRVAHEAPTVPAAD